MKYSLLSYILLFILLISNACATSSKSIHTNKTQKKEYIVRFKEGTIKDTVRSTLDDYEISNYSYITTSKKRGYIILINIESNENRKIDSIKKEKSIKLIEPNYKRDIYKQ